jgi:hypothetical protein
MDVNVEMLSKLSHIGHHHNSHAAIGGSVDVRHDIGSLWTQMGHDFQPCAVYYSGAGDGFHALAVGVFGCEGALWDCDVSREVFSVLMCC